MLQRCLKAPSWTPDCCVGSVIPVEPSGQCGPQKEIKDRSVFENKNKEGTGQNISLSVISGGRRRFLSFNICVSVEIQTSPKFR